MTRRQRIRRNTLRSIFIAIIILQDFVPFLGNIPLGPLSITTLHVTVCVAAIVLGPVDGAIVGGTWGILTWVRAFVAPSSPLAPLVLVNPLVSVFPRIMIGLVAGYLYRWLSQWSGHQKLAMAVAGVVGSLTNTGLVLGLIYLFYQTPAVAQAYGVNVAHLLGALLVILATNGSLELVFAAVAVPLIAYPVAEVHRRLAAM
ncbi:ECF transporter S component [Limosilactobacillus panis]|uniref:ECF transporter S component n=1 Tax=Limosilactobacillus panis TaxID=47493 RepID=A0ABT7VPM0_9LACO|nr:ECF transporter S component [Limosilactobacillus panis]MDM8334086.1 ECF transporter S component [Limosilactobacillus panis]